MIRALTIATALLIAGCAESSNQTSTTSTAGGSSSKPRHDSCAHADRELVRSLQSSLVAKENGPRLKNARLRHAFIARDRERKNVWFVSAALHGAGFDGDIATWAVSKSALHGGTGLIVAADNFADEFSEFGDYVKKGSPRSVRFTEEGGSKSRECVENAE